MFTGTAYSNRVIVLWCYLVTFILSTQCNHWLGTKPMHVQTQKYWKSWWKMFNKYIILTLPCLPCWMFFSLYVFCNKKVKNSSNCLELNKNNCVGGVWFKEPIRSTLPHQSLIWRKIERNWDHKILLFNPPVHWYM